MAKLSKSWNRKELKQPDQFVSFWTRFSQRAGKALAERKKAALIGLGVLAGVVTASLIMNELSDRASVRSSQALARVEKIATADLAPTEATAPKDGVAHFKTDGERLEAALKELDGFLAAEPHNPLRREALLQKAGLLLDLQRADQALPIYTDLLASRLDPGLRFLALEGQGYAYEAKGELDQAAGSFSKLGDSSARPAADPSGKAVLGFYRDRALYHQARIAERRGNPNEAIKLYKEVLEKAPASTLRDEISNRLAVLEPK